MLLQRAQMHPRIAYFVFLSVLTRTFSCNGCVWGHYQVQTDSGLLWANLRIRGEGDRLYTVLNRLDINQLTLATFSLIIQDSPVSTVPGMNMARLSNCLRCWICMCCLTWGRHLRLDICSPIPHDLIQNTLLRTQNYSLKTHCFENKSQWLSRVPVPAVFILAKL